MSRVISSDKLDSMRAFDTEIGEGIRFFAPVYSERRELIAALDAAEEVFTDHDRLVRELDVLLNGVDGAAPQARLVDLVAQVKHMSRQAQAALHPEQLQPAAPPALADCTLPGGNIHTFMKYTSGQLSHCLGCGAPPT